MPPIFSSYQLHSQLIKNRWELNSCEKQREGRPSAFFALLISLRLTSRRRASAFRFLSLRRAFQANEGEDRTRESIYRVIETRERMEKDRKVQIWAKAGTWKMRIKRVAKNLQPAGKQKRERGGEKEIFRKSSWAIPSILRYVSVHSSFRSNEF